MLINLRNALMTGKRTPTAKDYLRFNPTAMWDGIENAGWGVHDANATVWKDLIGSNDATYAGSAIIGDVFAGIENRGQICSLTSGLGTPTTVQIVCKISTNNGCVVSGLGGNNSGYSDYIFWASSHNTMARSRFTANTTKYQIPFSLGEIASFTWVDDGARNDALVAKNGVVLEGLSLWTEMHAINPRSFGNSWTARSFAGGVYAVRTFSNALTASEIAELHAIDKARFGLT